MTVFQPTYRDSEGHRVRSEKWAVRIWDLDAKPREFGGYVNRRVAQAVEHRLMQLRDHRAAGLSLPADLREWLLTIPPAMSERLAELRLVSKEAVAGQREIDALIDEWRTFLEAQEFSKRHVVEFPAKVRSVLKTIGAARVAEIDRTAVENYLLSVRKGGIAIQTSNITLSALKAFCGWAVMRGFLAENPLSAIKKLNGQTDRRRVRRALTTDEVARLIAATEAGPRRERMDARERAMLYRVAVATGLRRGELRDLLVGDIDFDAEAIHVRAAVSKNARDTTLPLRSDLVEPLKAHIRGKLPTARVFVMPPNYQAALAITEDLAAAGIASVDGSGRIADFHALRHTFATALALANVPLTVAQKLMRHSTPMLTAKHYTHLTIDDLRGGVEAVAVPKVEPRDAAKEA